MAELRPLPFETLLDRAFVELESQQSIFDIRRRQFYTNPEGLDFSVRFHGKTASTPYGPASGPQTQMAQNMVLAWLCGARIFELKTVQIMDQLQIPRPCIDVPNVGFNVEWSQELRVEESLHEYVKGAMLIAILAQSGELDLPPAELHTIYDMSVGYDLAGIKSEKVSGFIRTMMDCGELVEYYRAQIPARYAHLREIDFPTRLSDSITISTFHGCPPSEVEDIAHYLLTEIGTHTVIKFNPTQLGPERLRSLLNDTLGYDQFHVPDKAFADDVQFAQGTAMCERLLAVAAERGLGFGAKFSNTLILKNPSDFLPSSEEVVYLSGRPLHALATHLVQKYREHFGARLPISFSAGIDSSNFVDAVALGLVPITVCTDLLKKGGYSRGTKYMRTLARAMVSHNAQTIGELIVAVARANGDLAEGVAHCAVANTAQYVARLIESGAYHRDQLDQPPAKPGTLLTLFDCLTCDICIPVCPNHANFTYDLASGEVPVTHFTYTGGRWHASQNGEVSVNKRHQIANFADFCNECGNCDVFCPDLGGPYKLKPTFFSSHEQYELFRGHDGFYLRQDGALQTVFGRFAGREHCLTVDAEATDDAADLPTGSYRVDGLELQLSPTGVSGAAAEGRTIDGTYIIWLNLLRKGVLGDGQLSYPKLLATRAAVAESA